MRRCQEGTVRQVYEGRRDFGGPGQNRIKLWRCDIDSQRPLHGQRVARQRSGRLQGDGEAARKIAVEIEVVGPAPSQQIQAERVLSRRNLYAVAVLKNFPGIVLKHQKGRQSGDAKLHLPVEGGIDPDHHRAYRHIGFDRGQDRQPDLTCGTRRARLCQGFALEGQHDRPRCHVEGHRCGPGLDKARNLHIPARTEGADVLRHETGKGGAGGGVGCHGQNRAALKHDREGGCRGQSGECDRLRRERVDKLHRKAVAVLLRQQIATFRASQGFLHRHGVDDRKAGVDLGIEQQKDILADKLIKFKTVIARRQRRVELKLRDRRIELHAGIIRVRCKHPGRQARGGALKAAGAERGRGAARPGGHGDYSRHGEGRLQCDLIARHGDGFPLRGPVGPRDDGDDVLQRLPQRRCRVDREAALVRTAVERRQQALADAFAVDLLHQFIGAPCIVLAVRAGQNQDERDADVG